MKNIFIFSLCLSLIFFLSCKSATNDNSQSNLDNSNINKVKTVSTSPTNQPLQKLKADREYFESGPYNIVLSNLAPTNSVMYVGEETIKPENLQTVKDLTNINPETIADFIEENEKPSKLKKQFDVYATLRMIKVKDSISTTIKSIQKNTPKVEGLILLSKVGFDHLAIESLVYTEFYDLSGKVKKQFCIINENLEDGTPKWIEVK